MTLYLFYVHYILNAVLMIGVISASDIRGFDDTVLFKIKWPKTYTPDLLDVPDSETMMVMSSNKEKYKCIIPNPQDKSKDSEDAYDGPNALDILQPLFSQSSCTYRIESYWTYEVCHGRYVRQYHDDRKTVPQEFFLGRWDKAAQDKLSKELDSGMHYPPPVKKLDGLNLPYLQMNLSDGTICDINGQPRRTSILYVCFAMGKNEIYSFKETFTCQYELVVLSSRLCQHPKYVPQENGEHSINCLPIEGAPRKPRNLKKIEKESMNLRHKNLMVNILKMFSLKRVGV